jgi:ketosteroid isomerase-like protein
MQKRLLKVLACLLILSVSSLAAAKKKKTTTTSPPPDKASLQKCLDDWSALDASKMAPYYAQGELLFFDVTPLKYNNWPEYEKGVGQLLKGYKSLKLTLNDDAQIHSQGNLTWLAATVKEDAVTSTGKHEMVTMRWTAVFQNQDGKWHLVHEHVSEPLP